MKTIFKNKMRAFIWSTLLFSPIFVGALTTPALSGYSVNIELDPAHPSANQTVSAVVELFGIDIDRCEILWFVDGVFEEKGIGQTEFFFKTKNWGKKTALTVQINTPQKGSVVERIQIIPVGVNLIWEADTHTPPFYKGKALNSSEAIIKIAAFPNFVNNAGQKISSENLIYKWLEDGKVRGDKSGYGKDSFSFAGPQLERTKRITVEIQSLDGALKTTKSVFLNSRRPEIVFYKKDPLLGILYNTVIENEYDLSGEELEVVATPFFFSRETQTNIEYQWTVNGKKTGNDGAKITLRKQGGTSGFSNILFEAQNLKKILQFAQNSFRVNFKSAADSENYFSF